MKKHLILTAMLSIASICGAYAVTVSKTVVFGQVAQYTEDDYDAGQMADGSSRMLAIYSGGTNTTSKLTAAADGFNTTDGATKIGNSGNKGSNLESVDGNGHKKYFIKFTAIKDEQVRLYYFHASYPTGKDASTFVNNTFYLSHKTNGYDATIPGVDGKTLTLKQIYFVDFAIPEDGTYYISVNGGSTSVNVSGIKFTYEEEGEFDLLASTVMTGAETYTASGLYVDNTVVVKTKAINSRDEDVTVTYDGKVGYRLNGPGNYVGVGVKTVTFQAGDILSVYVTKVPNQGSLAVYADKDGNDLVYDTQSYGVLGENKIVLPAAAAGKTQLYVARTATNTWNGNIYSMEVVRAATPAPMTLTLNADGYTTFSWDKNYTVDGATAYSAKWEEGVTTFVTLNELSGVIPAEAGIILAGDPYAPVTVTATAEEATADMSENALVGTVNEPVEAEGGKYLLARMNEVTAFYLYESGDYMIPVRKAYLPALAGAPVRVDITMNPGFVTPVAEQSEVKAGKVLRNGVLYIRKGEALHTISGVRVL